MTTMAEDVQNSLSTHGHVDGISTSLNELDNEKTMKRISSYSNEIIGDQLLHRQSGKNEILTGQDRMTTSMPEEEAASIFKLGTTSKDTENVTTEAPSIESSLTRSGSVPDLSTSTVEDMRTPEKSLSSTAASETPVRKRKLGESLPTAPTPSPAPSADQEPEPLPSEDGDRTSKHVTNEEKTKESGWSLMKYMKAELTRGYLLEHDEARYTEKRERVYTFMKIPTEMEKFMTFGFFQCTDAFLYIFTFLPLRFLLANLKLCVNFCGCVWVGRGRLLEPAQICDILKGVILLVSCLALNYVDTSMLYHIIRGQAIIKLYIIFNMLEVVDRLFSSFGQDILDALFWTATEPRGRKREHVGVLPHLLLAIIYVFLHAILVLFQATTLNVAFNSHNKALLTIMMSNNFVELKGSVFKKFEKNNLFQMSCSDVRERFHFDILLLMVCVRNMTEFSWNIDHLWVLIPDVLIVIMIEFLVDWVKHAFITKFNEIPSEVYRDYTLSLAYDMCQSRQKNAFSDHSDVVARRMGFIPLPLACLLFRVVFQSVKISGPMSWFLCFLVYIGLTTFKVLNSIVLLGKSCDLIKDYQPAADTNKKSARPKSPRPKSPSPVRKTATPKRTSSPVTVTFSELDPIQHQPSLTAKPLFCSNSTVSLNSLPVDGPLDLKKPDAVEELDMIPTAHKKPQKPLQEIDRYTMCSNRII